MFSFILKALLHCLWRLPLASLLILLMPMQNFQMQKRFLEPSNNLGIFNVKKLLPISFCSWPSEVWASSEESHRALSWFGKARSFFFFARLLFIVSMTEGFVLVSSCSRALMMMNGVYLETKTTHRKTSFCFLLRSSTYLRHLPLRQTLVNSRTTSENFPLLTWLLKGVP